MKIVIVTTALFCFLLTSLLSSIVSYAAGEVALHVQYAGGSAEPFIVMTDPGAKYTITQPYSWVRDETSRYNLVSYSVDDGDYIEISRTARGDFTLDVQMDSPHFVKFLAVIQYPISVGGNSDLTVSFSPASPTHDNWFDLNSEVTISVPYNSAELSGTRQQLVSWSFDRGALNNIGLRDDNESGSFTTKVIMSRPHTIEFSAKTQHYVNIISEYGGATPSGWYDAGSTVAISSIPPTGEFLVYHKFAVWDGAVIGSSEAYSTSIIVDSPKTLAAKWTTDYTQLAILVIATAAGATAAVTLAKKKKMKARSAGIIADSVIAYEQRGQQMGPTGNLPAPEQHDTELQQNSSAVVVEVKQFDKDRSYQNQIMEYALLKSIEMLETFRTSGMISDAKFSKIKEELEQGSTALLPLLALPLRERLRLH